VTRSISDLCNKLRGNSLNVSAAIQKAEYASECMFC